MHTVPRTRYETGMEKFSIAVGLCTNTAVQQTVVQGTQNPKQSRKYSSRFNNEEFAMQCRKGLHEVKTKKNKHFPPKIPMILLYAKLAEIIIVDLSELTFSKRA